MFVISCCSETQKLTVSLGGTSSWCSRLAVPCSPTFPLEGPQPARLCTALPYPKGMEFGANLLSCCPFELPVPFKRGP